MVCPNCGVQLVIDESCDRCGWIGEAASSQEPPLREPDTLVAGRYRILGPLPGLYGIRRYTAEGEDGLGVILLEAPGNEPADGVSHIGRLADILNRASHPSLPPLLESFEADGASWVALDVPPGRPLLEAWHDPAVTDWQRLLWLLQLCHGLEALHGASAIAMALFPESAIVVGDRVVLADPSGFQALPINNVCLSTSDYYTPPELFVDPARVTPRADIYAMGTLVTSLLVGRRLQGEDLTAEGFRPIREVLPAVPPEVEGLLLRAMQPDPANRQVSTARLADQLGNLQALLAPQVALGAASDIGLCRQANEDRYLLKHLVRQTTEGYGGVTLAAVADGMGGERGGATASWLALEHLEASLAPHLTTLMAPASAESDQEEDQAVFLLLQRAADTSAEKVREASRANPELRGMGTTLAVALVIEAKAYIANVGDSRVYLVSPDALCQISEDHTVTAELVRRGDLKAEEMRYHPAHGELTRALGPGMSEMATAMVELEPGQTLLLCSDGLTELVTEEEMAAVLEAYEEPEAACRELVSLANLKGGVDNVTAVALRRLSRRLFG